MHAESICVNFVKNIAIQVILSATNVLIMLAKNLNILVGSVSSLVVLLVATYCSLVYQCI